MIIRYYSRGYVSNGRKWNLVKMPVSIRISQKYYNIIIINKNNKKNKHNKPPYYPYKLYYIISKITNNTVISQKTYNNISKNI